MAVTRDRGEWYLEVASDPAAPRVQYDVALAAAENRDWREYPHTLGAFSEPSPEGIRWRHTLPAVLRRLRESGDQAAIAEAKDQRYVLMWPESHTARDIRRRWKAEGRA